MARKLQQREIVLLVGLVAILVWFIWNQSKKSLEGQAGRQANKVNAANLQAPVVMLTSLEDSLVSIEDRNRDLFAYGQAPQDRRAQNAREAANRQRIEEARKKAEEARSRPKPVVQPRPTTPRAPKPNFEYIGNLGPKNERFAVFTEGQEVLIANIGEEIKTGFVLKEIGFESVTIGYTDERYKDKTTELQLPKNRRR